jgi:hypothetical protein
MDELTKVWQVWNRTKIRCRLECDTHKNVRANRVKKAKTKMCAGVENCAKEQRKNMSKE